MSWALIVAQLTITSFYGPDAQLNCRTIANIFYSNMPVRCVLQQNI